MFNAKKHENERQAAMVTAYGNALEQHHGSKGSCEEARQSWQDRHGAQAARIADLCELAGERGAALAEADVFRKTVVDFIVSSLTGGSTAGRLFARHLQSELDLSGCSVDAAVKELLPADGSP